MVGFRAEKHLIAAIEAAAAAQADRPSKAEMIRRIVVGWLREHGYMSDQQQTTAMKTARKRRSGHLETGD
jgi:hypothetical protein